MSLTFTTADEVLKEDYKGPVREQLNNTVFLLSQVEKNTDDVVGRHAVVPIHLRRTSGIGARPEMGDLPTAGSQGYEDVRVPLRWNTGRVQLSLNIIQAMSKDRGSFVRAVDSEMAGVQSDLSRDGNRQVNGTSDGVIATFATKASNTVLDLDADTTPTQMRQLYNQGGMSLDIGTTSDYDSVSSANAVVSYDVDNQTITVASAVATTAGDVASRHGNGGASDNSGKPGGGDGQHELTGIQSIVDDTADIQTITTSAEPIWKSIVDENGGTPRAVSELLVNKLIQDTEINSGQKIDLLLSNAPVHRQIADLFQATRRNIDNVELEAGYSGVKWYAVGEGSTMSPKATTLVWDQDVKENTLFGLCTDKLVEYVGSDWDWMDQDGAVLSRVPNKGAYEATLYKFHELCTTQRNAHFRLDDIQQTS